MPIADTHKYRHAWRSSAAGQIPKCCNPCIVPCRWYGRRGVAMGKTYPLPSKARYRNGAGMKAGNVGQRYIAISGVA